MSNNEKFRKERPTSLTLFFIVFLVVLFLQVPVQASPPRYDLGKIPDQTAWHGTANNFLVKCDEMPSATLSVAADPQPDGGISLEPSGLSGYWLFIYTPASSDNTHFNVTISASTGAQTVSQVFIITPQPTLQPEQSVFGIHEHIPPIVTGYEIQVYDQENPVEELFNFETMKTKNIQIVGEEVVIESGHANGLYEAYFDGSRRDIKEMIIIGEKVSFKSPAYLKQTDVTIYARTLLFEGPGLLKTTPEEKLTTPAQFQNGVDGLKAGNVRLNISQIYYETAGPKIDLTGGRGQPGGAGQDGTDGVSVNIYYNYGNFCVSCNHYLDWGYYCPSSGQYVTWTECGGGNGNSTWPTSGTNARASGKPGKGGAGGNLITNPDLLVDFLQIGGNSGSPTYPISGYGYYRGGSAGFPRYALHVHFYWDTWSACVGATPYQNPTWPTQDGTNADVTMPNTTAGPAGSYTVSGYSGSWLHPQMLIKILNHAREDYMGGYISDAGTRLKDYEALIKGYRTDAGWNDMDDTARFEIEQMYDEILILLQQIENNLDYFGNPAGWVPMLSFEVNYAMFSQEIDRTIRMLYLVHWIRTTEKSEAEKAAALVDVREQLKLDIEQARNDYDQAVSSIPIVKNKAESLRVKILETQGMLEARENQLSQEIKDPAWLAGLKGAFKGAALACKIIPVFQPGIGAMGKGMEMVSNVDPDMPWQSIFGSDELFSTFLDSNFDIAAENQQTAISVIDTDAVETEVLDYLRGMRSASFDLSSGLSDINNFVAQNKASKSDLNSELERVKSMDPEYQSLIQQVEELSLQNREFVDELISTMQKVAALSNQITRSMLAIDAMNRDAAPGLLVCDGRASAYLDEMEQRTYYRLLKYHYYLARAYEYRLLKPYNETLSLQGLMQKFEEIAGLNSDHAISPAQFETLKSLYEDKLAVIAESVFTDYNSNTPELTTGQPFPLTSNEIASLNRGETVSLNLMKQGFFFPDEENVRIVGLKVHSIVTEPIGGSYGTNPMVRIRMEHAGLSNFKTDGSIYQFRHYNSDTANPIIWEARWYPDLAILNQTKPSAASQSLLCTLLGMSDCTNLLFFSRPSAWADLKISRSCRDTTCSTINIKNIVLDLDFDFMQRNESLARKDFEILVSTANTSGSISEESDFMPYFTLSRPDFNGRQDARGRALRIYEYSSNPVEVTAQSSYGKWEFSKWTDRYGFDLPGGPFDLPTINRTPVDDLIICAQYVLATGCPGDFDEDGDIDGIDLSKFNENDVSISVMASEFGRTDCNQ